MKKNVSILGSTGSIGRSTLDIIRKDSENKYNVIALTCNSNIDLLIEQAIEFRPEFLAISDNHYRELSKRAGELDLSCEILSGMEGLIEVSTLEKVDIVIGAVVGQIGLRPSLAAISAHKKLCLANKETLVVGGHLVRRALKKSNGSLIPIDSEHSAIWQLLEKSNYDELSKIIITASGGPFRKTSGSKLDNVTVKEALNHPNWSMGSKITIDSATLMNKGLEVIEAAWLFNLPIEKIDVVVHPQSIIHSMIEFIDGSIFAHMGHTDMRLPIHYALNYPEKFSQNILEPFDLTKITQLTFEKPRYEDFPCLNLAYEALRVGHSLPAVLNSANEAVVELFLKNRIKFTAIPKIIEKFMKNHVIIENPDIDTLLKIEEEIKIKVREMVA